MNSANEAAVASGSGKGDANIELKSNKDMSNAANELVAMVSPSEAKTISIIMNTLMPSMFNLFSNITSDDYKANFKEPCRFDSLLDIFKQLPPFFDIIANKYPNKPDLVAYYSMQLASTFLVNNGSLTMACLYNMLSLQTRLMSFSIDIMDNPEKNPQLVGLFGIFMKPVMGMLKKNAMMQIIDHVDRYDKNDDLSNVTLFNLLNVVYCFIGLIGILSNIFLVILLKRSSSVLVRQRNLTLKKFKLANEKQSESMKMIQSTAAAASGGGGQLSKQQSGKTKPERPEMRSKKRVINTLEDNKPSMKVKTDNANTHTTANGITSVSHHKSASSHRSNKLTASNNKSRNHTHSHRNSDKRRHRHRNHSKRMKHQNNHHQHHHHRKNKSRLSSKYKLVKKTQLQLNYAVKKRYSTRICFMIIAICHSIYLLMNFIIMSQASIAAIGLQSISQLNLGCKISFMLFPPTTAYTFLHQLAIWLLVYAIRQHGIKLRTTPTHSFDNDEDDGLADYEINLIKGKFSSSDGSDSNEDYDSDESSCCYSDNEDEEDEYKYKDDIYNSFDEDNSNRDDVEEDTVSQSLTNNSQPSSSIQQGVDNNAAGAAVVAPLVSNSSLGAHRTTVQFMDSNPRFPLVSQHNLQNQPLLPASMHIMSTNPYNQNVSIVAPSLNRFVATNTTTSVNLQPLPPSLNCCACYSSKNKNLLFCVILFMLLFVYNGQNLFLYSLSELKTPNAATIYYCAFEQTYSDYYTVLNQYVIPLTNLMLFAILPLALCTTQVLLDICFLVRVQREQMKRYLKLRDIIEWPLYVYFLVYMISQLPFAMHQIHDLILGTVKFPFVFPLFIQFKFTSKIWLTVIEMTLICLACSSDLYIWIICDREMRQLAKYWLNKRIFCRTYAKPAKKKLNSPNTSRSCSGSSSSRSGSNSVEVSDHNINSISNNKNPAISSTSTAMTALVPSASLINQQNTNTNNIGLNQNSYASSTLSSTASSSHNNNINNNNNSNIKKKSISPIITESIKASAALSASSTMNSNEFFDSQSPVKKNQVIRMIDTDNEDIDVSNDSSMGNEHIRLDKLDEEDKLDISLNNPIENNNYEKSMHPPSFKTAIKSRPLFNSNTNNNYSHHSINQYGGIDLNIHPNNQLPKIVQYHQTQQ